jgi:hypothetical protein
MIGFHRCAGMTEVPSPGKSGDYSRMMMMTTGKRAAEVSFPMTHMTYPTLKKKERKVKPLPSAMANITLANKSQFTMVKERDTEGKKPDGKEYFVATAFRYKDATGTDASIDLKTLTLDQLKVVLRMLEASGYHHKNLFHARVAIAKRVMYETEPETVVEKKPVEARIAQISSDTLNRCVMSFMELQTMFCSTTDKRIKRNLIQAMRNVKKMSGLDVVVPELED